MQIKESKSDLEMQKIIKESNNCLKEINNEISNESYLEAVELLAENDRLNNEAIEILKQDENNLEKEVLELKKYDWHDFIKEISDSNLSNHKERNNVEILI